MHRPRRRRRLRRFWLLGSRNVRGDFRSRNGRCGSFGLELRNALLQLLHALEQYPDLLRLIERRGTLCPGSIRSKYHHHKDRQLSMHESLLCFSAAHSPEEKVFHREIGIRLPSCCRKSWLLLREPVITLVCAGEWSVFYASRLDCQTKLFLKGEARSRGIVFLHPIGGTAKKKN